MLPQYQRLDAPKPRFLVPFGRFSFVVVSLPLTSFLFCVICCLLFYFERSTDTHCHVRNYLPSISAAIGNYQPQRFIWQLAIILHGLPRFFIAGFYHKRYQSIIRKRWRWLAALATVLNIVENISLQGLTYFTSVDHYEKHKNFFVTFIATSELYMLLSYLLNRYMRRQNILSTVEERSVKYKGRLFLTNLISFGLAGYCFMRHNSHCEAGGE